MPAALLGIDAFADGPYRGNAAVVCLLDAGAPVPSDDRMQALATRLGVSETAFVEPVADRPAGGARLRWFTPTVEVELCGHATLASAHALWETGRLDPATPARFETRWHGELVASRHGDGIALDLPALSSTRVPEPAGLAAALGAPIVATGVNELHHVVELVDAAAVRSLDPDLVALHAVDVAAVTVTARADDARFDFVSRYFAPRSGIAEDPVTGSAHCSLGPWWAPQLHTKDLVGLQVSGRGGVVRVRVRNGRVTLLGRAATRWTDRIEL